MKNFKSLYKRFLFKFAINPFTYLITFLFIIISVVRFFLLQNFFSSTASTDLRVFFQGIPYIAVLLLPALSSLLSFSEEELTWPGKNYSIPLAKILSLMTVLLVASILTFFLPLLVSFYGDLDLSQVVCAYLLLFLYFLVSSALSIFFFTVISNKGLAFVLTALILSAVNFSHLLARYFSLSQWLSWLLKEISFAWHFDAAGKGIIDTRDIFFFIALFFFFFAQSIFAIEKKRGNPSKIFRQYKFFTFVTFILIIALSARLYKRIDTTKSKYFTVSEYSKKIIAELDEPLQIYYYRTPSLKNIYPQVKDVEEFLLEYASQNKNISLEILDPVKEDAVSSLNNYGIYGDQVGTSSRGDSVSLVYSAIVMNYLGRIETIPVVYTNRTLEFDLTSRMEAMVLNVQRAVQILTGNGLDLEEDYSYVEPWLQTMGFVTLHTYRPSEARENGGISFSSVRGVPLLILGTSYFNAEDTQALKDYIQNGGKVFIATTPFTVDIANDWSIYPQSDNVIYLLQRYGIYFKDSLTADISNFRITFYSDTSTSGQSVSGQTEYVNYPLWPVLLKQKNALNGLSMFWPAAITFDSDIANEEGFTVEELLFTSSKTWQVEKVDGKYETNPFYFPQTAEDTSQYKSECVCLEAKNKNTDSALFLYGDQYAYTKIMFNYAASSVGDMRSFDFLLDSLLKLNDQEEILPLKNRETTDQTLYKIDSSNKNQIYIEIILITCLFPLAILFFFYIVFYIFRKKKNSALKKN